MRKWLFLAVCVVLSVSANAASVLDNYNSRLKAAQVIEPLGMEDFGQAVSLQDGSLSFSVTDISVPTNGLPVTFGRRLNIRAFSVDELGGGTSFASMPATPWEMDVPYMSGTFEASYGGGWGSANQSQPYNRCTNFGDVPTIFGIGTFHQVVYTPKQYSSGVSISVPGRGTESVKQAHPGTQVPSDGRTYVGTTPSHWKIACLTTLKRGQGQGFRAVLPDGTIYHFDWLVTRQTGHVNDNTCEGSNQNYYRSPDASGRTFQGCWTQVAVPRVEAFLFATEMYDRFGNKTEYSFNPARPFELTSIKHNDESFITFSYSGGRLVSSTSFGRVWTYTYGGVNGSLTAVTQPDGSQWKYQVDGALFGINWYHPMLVYQSCLLNLGTKTSAATPSAGETSFISITSPSGATARFDVRKLLHGTRQGLAGCYYQKTAGGGTTGPIVPYPSVSQVASIYKLTVSGPGLDTYTRNYSYQPGWNPPYEATTTVSDSAGKTETYRFGGYTKAHGKLLEHRVLSGSTLMSSVSYAYLLNNQGQNFPEHVGIQFPPATGWFDGYDSINVPLVERAISQDGKVFRWRVPQDCDGRACFDAFVRPTKVERGNFSP